jgi:surface protein
MRDRNVAVLRSPSIEDNRLYSDVTKIVGAGGDEEQLSLIYGTVSSYSKTSYTATVRTPTGRTYSAQNYNTFPLIKGAEVIIAKTETNRYAIVGTRTAKPMVLYTDSALITAAPPNSNVSFYGKGGWFAGMPSTTADSIWSLQGRVAGASYYPDYYDSPIFTSDTFVGDSGALILASDDRVYTVNEFFAFVTVLPCESIYEVASFGDALYAVIRACPNLVSVPANLPAGMVGLYFRDCSSLNDPRVSSWDTSSFTTMRRMFLDCTAFNQNLGNLNVENVTNMQDMLVNTNLSPANYDATLNGWAAQDVQPYVVLDADNLNYTAAGAAARAVLTGAPNYWVITDAGQI